MALTAFAGARRTNDAVSQFVKYSLPDDGGFLFGKLSSPPLTHGVAPGSLALPPVAQRIVDLPQVVAHFRSPYLFVTTRRTGRTNSDLSVIGDADPDFLRRVDRPMVLSGRLPGPSQPFEVVVNDLAARADRLRVGSTLHLYAYTKAQIAGGALAGAIEQAPPAPKGPSFTVRVAAIVRFPQDVSAVAPLEAQAGVSYESDRNLYVTPAFLRKLAWRPTRPCSTSTTSIWCRSGCGTEQADWEAFAARATAIGRNDVFVSPGNVFGVPAAAASAQRGIHLDVVALLLFGALVSLVTVVLVGQAVARQTVLQRRGLRRTAGSRSDEGSDRWHRRTSIGPDRAGRGFSRRGDCLASLSTDARWSRQAGGNPSRICRRPRHRDPRCHRTWGAYWCLVGPAGMADGHAAHHGPG